MEPDQHQEKNTPLGVEDLGTLEFGPEWAKESANKPISVQPTRERSPRHPGKEKHARGKRPRPSKGRGPSSDRPGQGRKPQSGKSRPRSAPVLKGIRVRFTPERHALQVLIKLIRHNHMMYTLDELAALMMSKAEHSCRVVLETTDDTQAPLYQCQGDKAVFRDAESALQHAFESYVSRGFDRIEEQGEPPKGVFQYVGKCSQSGVILGPPNHHEYPGAVQKLWEERFAHQDLETFKQRIELIADPEAIETWKQQASKVETYRAKTQSNAETLQPAAEETDPQDSPPERKPVRRAELEKTFREELAGTHVQETRKAVIPAKSVPVSDPELIRLINFVLRREQDRPVTLLYALRSALKHQGVHVFKWKGEHHVNAVEPKPINPASAVEDWAVLLNAICSERTKTREQVVEAHGEVGVKTLKLLVDRGHVLEASDHTLHAVTA